MNKIKKTLPAILAGLCLILAAGALIKHFEASLLENEIANLKSVIKEKENQVVKMQEDLGSEISARKACESDLSALQEQTASATQKLEAFALQASACEQIRKKLNR